MCFVRLILEHCCFPLSDIDNDYVAMKINRLGLRVRASYDTMRIGYAKPLAVWVGIGRLSTEVDMGI